MPTASSGSKTRKRRRSSPAAVTAEASSQALRTLIAERFSGNFGTLAAAISDGTSDKSLRAKIWRAQAERRPSTLDPELAQRISRIARPKSAAAKKAVKLIRAVAKGAPAAPKDLPDAKPDTLERLVRAPVFDLRLDGKEILSILGTPDLVKRNEDGYVLHVPIDAETALRVLLPE
jgi:hypothetical protein